jgi:1-phosphatidylinositol phosphodiesterase
MSRYGYGSFCQNTTLTEQLTNGVRVVDIRVRYLPGAGGRVNFSIHHSDYYQFAFFDSLFPYTSGCKYWVLDECLEYLKTHDQECIVMLIKQEKDAQVRATFFDAFWKIIDNRNGYNGKALNQLFYVGNSVPTLGQVRGRIVFVFVDGDDGPAYQLSAPRWGLYWGNIDYQVDWTNPLPGQVPNLDVENHWKDLMDWKWDKVKAHLDKTLNMGPLAIIWCVTFLSASRVPDLGYFPKDYADYLLPKLMAYIQANINQAPVKQPWGAYFGTVMMDFPGNQVDWLIGAALAYQYP